MTLSRFALRLLPVTFLFTGAPAPADVLDDILERGTIRVGVAEFVPWTMKTGEGELIGFEIDVSNKLAADIGVRPEYKVYTWDNIIGGLQRGEIDVIAGGMAITPKRALQVNFSRPLAQSGVGLALNTRLTNNVKTLAALNRPDIVIATVVDTLAHSVSKSLFNQASIKAFETTAEAEKELLEGRAHGYLAGMSEVTFLSLKQPDAVEVPMSEPLVASSEAFAVRKGEQQLLNFLDAWVTARQSDKWLPTTRDYWFATLDWLEEEDGK